MIYIAIWSHDTTMLSHNTVVIVSNETVHIVELFAAYLHFKKKIYILKTKFSTIVIMARFENVSFSVTVLCGLEQNATAAATGLLHLSVSEDCM